MDVRGCKYLAGSDNVDKAVDVDVDKCGHQELTVEPIHDSSVAWDYVTKIFYLKRSLESRGEEATEGTNNGGKE